MSDQTGADGVPESTANAPMASRDPNARRAPTTSSERGKAFRARRRIYKGQLQEQLTLLHTEIARLEERKSLLQTRLLQRRESSTGSLARLVREYYTIFRLGMGDHRRARIDPVYARRNAAEIAYKENFLRTIMAEDAITGDLVGPDASLMQWHFFSAAHAHVSVHIDRVDVIGDPNDPIIDLHSTMHFVYGPHTLAMLFPGVEENHELVRKCENRTLQFPVLTRFKFGADGRICYELVNSNLLDGYLRAGLSLADIVHMFKYMVVSPSLTVKTPIQNRAPSNVSDVHHDIDADPRRTHEPRAHGLQAHVPLDSQHGERRVGARNNKHWYIHQEPL